MLPFDESSTEYCIIWYASVWKHIMEFKNAHVNIKQIACWKFVEHTQRTYTYCPFVGPTIVQRPLMVSARKCVLVKNDMFPVQTAPYHEVTIHFWASRRHLHDFDLFKTKKHKTIRPLIWPRFTSFPPPSFFWAFFWAPFWQRPPPVKFRSLRSLNFEVSDSVYAAKFPYIPS